MLLVMQCLFCRIWMTKAAVDARGARSYQRVSKRKRVQLMKLNDIRDNDGARKSRMRVGRGIGSGKG